MSMSGGAMKQDPWTATGTAAARLIRRQSSTNRAPRSARPGDIYVTHRTANYDIAWLVLDTDAHDRILVVPLDDYPLVGSRDLHADEETLPGSVTVRCDLGAWLNEGTLDTAIRVDVAPPSLVVEVLRKRTQLTVGAYNSTLVEETVDDDPSYEEWLSVLRSAVSYLIEAESPDVAPAATLTFLAGGQFEEAALAAASGDIDLQIPFAAAHQGGRLRITFGLGDGLTIRGDFLEPAVVMLSFRAFGSRIPIVVDSEVVYALTVRSMSTRRVRLRQTKPIDPSAIRVSVWYAKEERA